MPMPVLGCKGLVVFTDLDGTLLDARTYAPDAGVRATIKWLRARGIPVVFCSSKTWAEQSALQDALDLADQPCIVENGAAIVSPEPCAGGRVPRVLALGARVGEIRKRIQRIEMRMGRRFSTYASIGPEEVSRLTGLGPEAARRAAQREFSETLVDELSPAQWEELEECFAVEGLQCLHGGRFRTVTGSGTDKGRAVAELAARLGGASGASLLTAALGDSANDRSMLAAVHLPVLLQNGRGSWIDLDLPNLRRVCAPGPEGWTEGVMWCLEAFERRRAGTIRTLSG